MNRVFVFLQKYSDWLEAYSVIEQNSESPVFCYFLENNRNDYNSVKAVFDFITNEKASYYPLKNIQEMEASLAALKDGDILVAPFCRIRSFWRATKRLKLKIQTICLSESLPESFGLIGYRLGFRGRTLKTKLALPLLVLYDTINKPDIGYFPYSKIKNPFVKESFKAAFPPLSTKKQNFINEITGGTKRPLIVSGWGYNLENMVNHLKLKKYIATSKGMELVIDGNKIPITERICSEEVLLSGCVSNIIGYNSATMIWAKYLFPDIKIECFETNLLNKLCGKFGKFSRKTFRQIGLELKNECKEMLD